MRFFGADDIRMRVKHLLQERRARTGMSAEHRQSARRLKIAHGRGPPVEDRGGPVAPIGEQEETPHGNRCQEAGKKQGRREPPVTGPEGEAQTVRHPGPEGDAEHQEIRLITSVDADGRVVVSIEDTGTGIAPEVMTQLFTPFVTTKPAGVGTGLGLSMGKRFLELGASLAICGRREEVLKQAAAELEQKAASGGSGRVAWQRCDIRDAAAVDAMLDALWAEGPLDALVNNAGITKIGPSMDYATTDWRRILDVNVTGLFLCSQHAARRMSKNGGGSILNIASISSFTGQPQRAAYVASKSAVLGMTRALAVEWGPIGIRVNALAPGYIETDLVADLVERGVLRKGLIEARTPLRRLGTPQDLVDGALYLLSERAAFATGQVLTIDGGWLANGYIT